MATEMAEVSNRVNFGSWLGRLTCPEKSGQREYPMISGLVRKKRYGIQCPENIGPASTCLHQRGVGPPAGAGSVSRAGRVFTLARVRAQFHFAGAPFRGTGSLIYKYRLISAPYSCGSRRRIAPWAISVGARRGGGAGPRRCKQHHIIPSNRSTAKPAGGIQAFSALV